MAEPEFGGWGLATMLLASARMLMARVEIYMIDLLMWEC